MKLREYIEQEKIAGMNMDGEFLEIDDLGEKYLEYEIEILNTQANFAVVQVFSIIGNDETFILYDNHLWDNKALKSHQLCDHLKFPDPTNLEELVDQVNELDRYETAQIYYDFTENKYSIASGSGWHDLEAANLRNFNRGEDDWSCEALDLEFDKI